MLLVNDSFQMAILQINCYFLLKKCENPLQCSYFLLKKDCKGFSHISTKNNSVFAFEVDILLTNRRLNDTVKPMKF